MGSRIQGVEDSREMRNLISPGSKTVDEVFGLLHNPEMRPVNVEEMNEGIKRRVGIQGTKIKRSKDSRGQGVKNSRRMLKHYKELKVWQKAYKLCLKLYKITASFPTEEKYGLASQIKRAALSIPSNIAEGYGRKTTADYIRILYIAYGSVCEVETQVMLAGDMHFIVKADLDMLMADIREVERMLKAQISALERKTLGPSTP